MTHLGYNLNSIRGNACAGIMHKICFAFDGMPLSKLPQQRLWCYRFQRAICVSRQHELCSGYLENELAKLLSESN